MGIYGTENGPVSTFERAGSGEEMGRMEQKRGKFKKRLKAARNKNIRRLFEIKLRMLLKVARLIAFEILPNLKRSGLKT